MSRELHIYFKGEIMKLRFFLCLFMITLNLYSLAHNPFVREPAYCMTPCNAFEPKYREFACVVVNDVADDAVHYLNAGYYSYYSY